MPARSSTGLWIVAGVLLVLAAVPPLLTSTYARTTPALGGFPFFFWYQFALVIFAAICTSIAFVLAKEAFRRDRVARAGQRKEDVR
jgi:uncharacterized membrane protein YdjX (TVP38/TMEM64 family)